MLRFTVIISLVLVLVCANAVQVCNIKQEIISYKDVTICQTYNGIGEPVACSIRLKATELMILTTHCSYSLAKSELEIPTTCKDNPLFAICNLIVNDRFCIHKYYSNFCCKSCVEAGQLEVRELELQADHRLSRY